jgi:hypothetical protein
MLCVPVLEDAEFRGLLFAACQIGSWRAPVTIASDVWDRGYLFLLVDSNGVCLMPPRNELQPSEASIPDEERSSNCGYPFRDLLGISRRDKLVSRVMENVIPLHQDDDVLPLGNDLSYYTVMTELKSARWKLAVSSPIKISTV